VQAFDSRLTGRRRHHREVVAGEQLRRREMAVAFFTERM
jgi:hypothetical protein